MLGQDLLQALPSLKAFGQYTASEVIMMLDSCSAGSRTDPTGRADACCHPNKHRSAVLKTTKFCYRWRSELNVAASLPKSDVQILQPSAAAGAVMLSGHSCVIVLGSPE